ncbi:unnamed protein product [Rhizophagus irregularis]|nr:unnamed protein product [Rhizophagus irregularis]
MLEKRVYQAVVFIGTMSCRLYQNFWYKNWCFIWRDTNIFINKSQKRGYDLLSFELSEYLSSLLYSSQETIEDAVDNPFFVSNKATAVQDEEGELTKYIRDQESEKIFSELPSVEESARDPILEFPDDPLEVLGL